MGKILGVDTHLEGGAKHHIVCNVLVGAIILGELKEEGLVHRVVRVVSVAHLGHLRVEVPDQGILREDGLLHQVHVGRVSRGVEHGAVEAPGFLGVAPAGPVVARERVEGADLVPPRAELGRGAISLEAANVRADQRNAEHVHLHRGDHRDLHVVHGRVVIAQPDRAIFAHACEVAPRNNHRSLLPRLEPSARGFHLEGTEKGVRI